jgi:hypothetical protein
MLRVFFMVDDGVEPSQDSADEKALIRDVQPGVSKVVEDV